MNSDFASSLDPTASIIQAFQTDAAETAKEVSSESQVVSKGTLEDEARDNPINIALKSKKLAAPEKLRTEKAQRAQESVLVRKDEADGLAEGFAKREGNKQFRLDRDQLSQLAQSLGDQITDETDINEIINLIRNTLTIGGRQPDVAQIDKTFDFLVEVAKQKANRATGDTKDHLQKLFTHLLQAKSKHYEDNQKDIETALKIIDVVDLMVEKGSRDTPETLAHLRDIIHNKPQELMVKFAYYKSRGYTYNEIKGEVDAILSYIGTRFHNNRIPKGELSRLWDETRTLQAMLNIFRLEKAKAKLARNLFEMQQIPFPQQVNFETLSNNFIEMVSDPYPSSKKVAEIISHLGV